MGAPLNMTPEELAQQLAALHEGSLRQLHQVIDGHKYYLRSLIRQAQAEVESLTATGDKSTAHAAEVSQQPEDDAATEETAAVGPKRKADATLIGASAAERPSKRRGRPAKHNKQPDINAEAMELQVAELEQLPEQDASQQPSASATVVAAQDAEAATADEATSAGAGARRRPARARAAAEAAAGGSTRSTRSRRGAAEPAPAAPAASSGSGRGRRGKARAAAAPAALEAIAEGEEQQDQEQQQQQAEDGMLAEQLLESAMTRSVAVVEAATEGVQQQQHQAQQLQPTELAVSEDAAGVGIAGARVSEQHLLHQDPATADAEDAADPDAGSGHIPQQSPDNAKQYARADSGQHEEGEHSVELEEPQCLDAEDEAEAEAALPAEAAQVLPKTPGFSLAPNSSQNMASDTPCFVGQVSRASRASKQQRQQQNLDSPAAATVDDCCPEPEAFAAGTSNDAAVHSGSGLPESSAGFKAQSLSFGEPLQAPLLENLQHEDADSTAAAVGQATTAGLSNAGGAAALPAAAAPVDWKAFISTIHPDDAPTPAVSRGRLRSQSGAGTSQQHSGPLRSTAAAAVAAAAASSRAEAGGARHGEATAAAVATAAAAPVSGRRVSRSSLQQLRSPRLQALQSDDNDFAADGARVDRAISFTPATNSKPKPARSPRPSLPRSAKRSAAAMAAAAEARGEELELEQQCLQDHLQQSEGATKDIVAPAESEMQDASEQFDDLDDEAATPVVGAEVLADTDMPETVGDLDMHDRSNLQGVAPPGDEHGAAAVDRVADEQQQQQQDDMDAEDVFHEVDDLQELDATDAEAATEEAATDAGPAVTGASAAQPLGAAKLPAGAAAAADPSKAVDPVAAWLAVTAGTSAGAAGDKAKQQLAAAKEIKAAAAPVQSATAAAGSAAGGRGNLVSGMRSFVPSILKKDVPAPVAAGKVKVKVKALETAEAVRKAEGVKAQERAARQQFKEQQPQGKGRGGAETEPAAGHKPQGTPSGAVAQSKVAAVECAAAGLSGSGGAVRVPAQQQEPEVSHKAADRHAAQKKAEKEAETAKRTMDRAEREDRMKRAEQKRKDEDQKRRQDLAEKQRLKEERAAAAAALKINKAAGPKTAGGAQPPRGAVDKVADTKTKQLAQADHNNCKTPAAPKAAARAGTAVAAPGGDAQVATAHADSPSLTIKLLEPVSTGNKAKGVMGPPAPVGAKTPAAFKTPAPPVSEQEKRNVEALKSSPFVNTGTKRTPFTQKPDPNSYIISPFRDDDVETPDRSHKPIPDWARSHKLYEALKAQQHTDPDTIFGARQTTCDLADMFADVPVEARQQAQQRHKQRKLGQRTSSADWSQDRLTWQEEVKYKKDMGYL